MADAGAARERRAQEVCLHQIRAIVRRGFHLLDETNQPEIPINSKIRMKEFTTSSNYFFTQEIL